MLNDSEISREVYLSVDIEADGRIPGPSSMLSLGAVLFDRWGTELSSFTVNLLPLEGSSPDPETVKWWEGHPEAYAATQVDRVDPKEGMERFCQWLSPYAGRVVFVAYPVTFDFMFVYWYLQYFGFTSPFSFSGLDMKTLAFCLMGTDYHKAVKRNMPRRWFPKHRGTPHVALDDARTQGLTFFNMLWDALALRNRA